MVSEIPPQAPQRGSVQEMRAVLMPVKALRPNGSAPPLSAAGVRDKGKRWACEMPR